MSDNEMLFSGFGAEEKAEYVFKKQEEDHKKLGFMSALLIGGIYEGREYKGKINELKDDIVARFDSLDKKLTPYIEQCDECLVEKEESKNEKKDTKRSLRDNVLFAVIAGLVLLIGSAGWNKITSNDSEQRRTEKRMALIMSRLNIKDTTAIGR